MKYNGSSWEVVGPTLSTGGVSWTSIAIDESGTPYVVYSDNVNSGKATVMKYNGSSWETVGIAGFSDSTASFTQLVIDANDTLYVEIHIKQP